MLRGASLETLGRPSHYAQRLLDWFFERAAQLGQEYLDLIAQAGDSFFDEPLDVPWFDFALTKADGLYQVLSHSAQHRAQVFSVLGERGVKVPDLDYVLLVRERASAE